MEPLLVFLYLFFCAIVGYFGRRARVGAWGVFFLSLLFTPLLVLSGLILLGPRKAG